MRLSALGGGGQRQGTDHEDDGPGADVSRQYALPYREAEDHSPDLWLTESGKTSPATRPRAKEVDRLSTGLTAIPPKVRHFIENRDMYMP